MSDLNKYTPALFEPTIVSEKSSFGQAVEATLGLRFAPIVEQNRATARFLEQERDPDFDWKENLGDYAMYASSLYRAKNAEHMAELKSIIDRSIKRREVLSNSTILTQLGAGLFDPINFMALPLGGPAIGVGGSMLRVGVGTAAIEGASELINLQLDPVKTIEEATINTATAAMFGGALGGAISIPRTVALERTNKANKEMFEAATRIEYLEGMTPEQIRTAPVRAERPLGKLTDTEIKEKIQSYEGGEEALPLKNELGLRKIEELGINVDDVYNLKASWFTKSPLYKMVSTPMKRTLQSDSPSRVKEIMLKSFGDNGITLALNSFGLPTPQSVAIRTAVSAGRWVKASDEMLKLWAADTNASPASTLDINLSDVARKLSRSDQTYRQWLTNVSEKRLRGVTDMSENELKASSVINKYFEDAETRLQEVGLLSDAKGMKRQIEMLDLEIEGLKANLAEMRRQSVERGMVEGRIKKLQDRRSGLDSMRSEPNAPFDKDVFFPRFFDKRAIKNRREEFSSILYNWFEKNPYVYRMDGNTPTKVDLSTNPDKIKERVDQTINGILGEVDPLSLDTVSFGMGRSKHFRSRQLDIPNKLVTDFMMKDPLAVMKTYAARIEPRYEFAKMFGKDLDGVRFDIELEMVRDGKSQAEINKVMRDYNHMYDRTIGTVLENPDALSQKAATVMREAASFSFMGSAGIAAIPDFGRIVMEYDMENVWKGVQALVDRERVNMTVDEVRMAGEAIDILRGSAHMRLMEDMSNNIDANDILSQTRNAFYILNGLAPLTTLAKQLAGVIDSHQIIDYSIKLGKGQLDDQGIEWLARHGIGKDMAAKIVRAPYEKTENGFYMANTDQWADSIYIPEIDGKQVRLIEANEDGSPVGKTRGKRYIPAFYNDKTKTINFDRDYIEGRMFDDKGWLKPKVKGVDPLPDIFDTPKKWANFVMLHEIMHSRYSAKALGFSKTVKVIDRNPTQRKVSFIRNRENVSGKYFVHFTRKSNHESLLRNGYDVNRKSIFPTSYDGAGKLAGDVMYFTTDMNRWSRANIEVPEGTGTKDKINYDYTNQEWVTIKKGLVEEELEPVGAFLADDAKILTIDSIEKYNSLTKTDDTPKGMRQIVEDASSKYDAIEIVQRNDGGWVEKEVDTYDEIFGNSGKHDFFVLNKDKVTFEKEVVEETIEGFEDIARLEEQVDTAGYENAINRLALEELNSQSTLNEETIMQFRAALNSGVLNTIMSGTPADKPIITDGVVYIPMSVASKFGMKEHPKFKGYARIENGLMGLPFQFYSFVFANVNKTVGALAQGQIKNRVIGSATMMGLAYMSLKLRTPEYIWNDMSAQDRFARSFDMSGIMALYSDIFYTAMHTSLALGGPNITGGLISPKFKQEPSVAEALVGLAGAGPSWTYDTAKGVVNFANGNYGEGGKDIVRNMPFARMWFLKDDVNQITNAWAN